MRAGQAPGPRAHFGLHLLLNWNGEMLTDSPGVRLRARIAALVTLAACQTMAAPDTKYKMTTPIAPGVATPDRLETSIGTLTLKDGFPSAETVDKIC